jgi:hypothetical protein
MTETDVEGEYYAEVKRLGNLYGIFFFPKDVFRSFIQVQTRDGNWDESDARLVIHLTPSA